MPKKQFIRRNYNFSDIDLFTLHNWFSVVLLPRDGAQLIMYGYDQPKIDAFIQMGDDPLYTNEDRLFLIPLTVATEEKQAAITELFKLTDEVIKRAFVKWQDPAHPKIKRYNYAGHVTMTDAQKLLTGYLVHTVGTEQLTDLQPFGLTQQMLDDLQAGCEQLRLKIIAKQLRVNDRDQQVFERITFWNKVFGEIQIIAGIGKHIHENKVYSGQYRLPANARNEVMETVNGTAKAGIITVPALDIPRKNLKLEFLNTGTVALTIYFAQEPDDMPGEVTRTILPGGEPTIIEVPDLGWTKNRNRLLIHNADKTVDGNFEIKLVRRTKERKS